MHGRTWYLLVGCRNREYTHKPVNYEMAFYVQLFHVILHFQGFAFLHCCIVALQCVGILQHKSSSIVRMRRRISGNACISMIELYGAQPVLQEKGATCFFFFFHPTIVAFPAQKVTTKLIGCKVGAQTVGDLSQPLLLVNRGRLHNCLFASFPERRQASCFKLLLKPLKPLNLGTNIYI